MSGANLFFNSMLAQYDQWSPGSDGNLIYTFVAGIFRAHHPQTGAVQWQTSVTWNWGGWSALTSPVIANGMAYVIAPPNLHAIDLSTHTVRWTASGLNFSGTPAVANGVVYAVSAGNIRAHDAVTGAFLWTFLANGGVTYPPVLTQTHLYASGDYQVFAVDLATHASVWSAPAGGWLSLANGSLYVAGRTSGLRAYSLTP
jgi:outer membrane protein assembly factor BamB